MTNTLFAPFLASWMLKEPVRKWDLIGIVLGFSGMLCLVQPWKSNLNVSESAKDFIGCCFGGIAALTAAIAIIYTRRLTGSLHYTV